MKLTLTIPLLAALFATTGCTTLLSTQPIVAEEDTIVDPLLPGTWTDGDDTVIIRLTGKAYEITYLDDGKDAVKFAARLVKAGDAMLLDVSRDSDDPFVMGLHFAVRVWPEAGMLRWTLVDSDWLKEQAKALPSIKEKDRTILTAGARELLSKLGADERAHGKIESWTRAQ
jgi:hypothetical protein